MNIISLESFLLFAFASLMLNITPGNDMIYVATRSVNGGIKTGIDSAIGVSFGGLVHMTAPVLGLKLVLAARK